MTANQPRYHRAPLASCEVPWDEKGALLEDVFRAELHHTLEHFNNLYIFGTAGEGYAVTMDQFRRIVEIFHEETRGDDIHPMVGVIGMSTPIVLEKLHFAYDIGFRTFQLSLPSWGTLTDAEMLSFFTEVCGTFPDARFLHYNLPRVGRVLEAPDYRPLIDAVPNLVATKNTAGGMPRASALVSQAGELQHFLGEGNYLQGCLYGECSLLATFGPLTPRKSKEYFQAGVEGDFQKLITMQKVYHDMLMDLFAVLGSERRIDGAYDKLWVKLGGFEAMPLRLLPPYHGLTDDHYRACKHMLQDKYPDWIG